MTETVAQGMTSVHRIRLHQNH